MPRTRILLLAVLVTALAPAAAQAENATVTRSTPENVYTGSSGVDDVSLSLINTTATTQEMVFQRQSPTAALMDAAGSCSGVVGQEQTRIRCPLGGVTFNLNAGDDKVVGGSDGHGITYNGGAGGDTISTSNSSAINAVNGDAGDDKLLATGVNRDIVNGGDGNDLIQFPRGFDDLHGGAGIDTIELSAGLGAISVSLDDANNDGAIGNIKGNYHADVENLIGGDEADSFTGSAAANGLAGNGGADELVGGPGQDTLDGGDGADTIDARDGAADTVNCGAGADVATVDPADTLTSCETVLLPDDDADGITAPQDCDDHDFAIRPGAVDTPGDGIDQDCSGSDVAVAGQPSPPAPVVVADADAADARRATIVAGVQNRWALGNRSTRIVKLAVREAPAHATVTVVCKGGGCPFDRNMRNASPKGKANLTKLFSGRSLRPGAVLEVRITAAGFDGKVVRYTIRRGKLPSVQVLCLPAGASKPRASC